MSNFVYDAEMLNETIEILKTKNRNDLAGYIQYLTETLLKLDDTYSSGSGGESSSSEGETTDEEYGEEDIGQTDDGFFYLK